MDERLPGQLSGGQQQRVAVARALAHKPQVLLLDEPFGALDAKIREELRRTIRQVQRELGITTVLVTHDQEEAFALADRIGVMNLGRLLEIGRPDELYARPATRFVATFLGAANLLLARQTARRHPFRRHAGERRRAPSAVHGGPRARSGRGAAARGSRARRARATTLDVELPRARRRRGDRVHRRARAPARAPARRAVRGAVVRPRRGNGDARLEVTRTQPEQRACRCSAGAARGDRRAPRARAAHAAVELPRLRAPPRPKPRRSRASRCSSSSSTRMKTRVACARRARARGMPTGPCATSATPFAGAAVIARATGCREDSRMAAASTAPTKCWCCRRTRRARSACSSTGPTKRAARHARGVREPAASRVARKRSTSASLPEGTPGAQRPRGMRALLDARSEAQAACTASRCAPSCASARPSTELTRNLSAGTATRCWCSASPTSRRPAALIARLLAAQPRLAGAHRLPAGREHRPCRADGSRRSRRMKTVGQREPSVMPGFGLTFGFTTFFLSALVLLPLAALVLMARLDGLARVRRTSSPIPRARRLLPAVVRRVAARGDDQPGVRLHHRLDAGALRVPGPQDHRRPHRHAVRAADGGVGHRAHRGVRAERLDRPVPRAARHQGGLHAGSASPSRSP